VWVTDHGLREVARQAPDFFAWRSGVFDVRSDAPELMDHVLQSSLLDNLQFTNEGDLRRRVSFYSGVIREQQAQESADEAFLARMYTRLAGAHYWLGETTSAAQAAEKALTYAELHDDPFTLNDAAQILGLVALDHEAFDRARELFLHALDVGKRYDASRVVASARHQLGTLEQRLENFEEAERWFRSALDLVREAGDLDGQVATLHHLGTIALQTQRYEEAEAWYREALDQAEKLGSGYRTSMLLHQMGALALARGDFASAREQARASISLKRAIGDHGGVAYSLVLLGVAEGQAGRPLKAAELLAEAYATFKDHGEAGPRADVARSGFLTALNASPADEQPRLKQQWLDAGLPPVWEGRDDIAPLEAQPPP
jgi:tetratricopeptide (TPR) repeat protein